MSNQKKDPGLFVFKEDEQVMKEAMSSTPSKPKNNKVSSSKNTEDFLPVSLYEYSLGIKNIEAKYITYNEAEVFVSKPMQLKGNVMEIELASTEEHPVFDMIQGVAIDKQTSVEYYLSYKQKPTASDWVPILPKNQKVVTGERLFLKSRKATFLFPSRMDTVLVYENGLLMDRNDYTLLSNQQVDIPRAKSGSVYTVSYTPDSYKKNPWVLQLNDYKKYVQQITERFERGTDINKTVSLAYTPFIDMERIVNEEGYNPNTSTYKPIQVTLTDASIQSKSGSIRKLVEPYRPELLEDAFTYNKTLYLDKSWSDMHDYSLDPNEYYGGFDYYQWKNKLTFTEQFNVKKVHENMPYTHGNATIDVTYDALVTDFRLKIILRRNTSTDVTATPKVQD